MRAFVTGSTGIRRGTLAWTQVLHAGVLAKSLSHSKCPSGSECPRVGVDLALNRGKTVLLTKTKVPPICGAESGELRNPRGSDCWVRLRGRMTIRVRIAST
jgi:hypothetical protein